MEKGFYNYRNCVYYGYYHKEQVSNEWKFSKSTLYNFKTDHPISENDFVVRLCDNHSLLEVEYENLQKMLFTMKQFINLNMEKSIDFSAVEERLNIIFPKELKEIYTSIQNQDEFFSASEHFLPLNELYIEEGILVFFKKKRNAVAGYNLKSGQLARYYKKEWYVERGDICCYQFCIGRILTIALDNKPTVKKGRCTGSFVTTLDINKELEHFCDKQYHILLDFNVYGIAVIYTNDG